MTAHPNPRQAFRQFQYLTVPLRSLGERPKATAAMAASMLDPSAARRAPT